jgi:hypothetical protein
MDSGHLEVGLEAAPLVVITAVGWWPPPRQVTLPAASLRSSLSSVLRFSWLLAVLDEAESFFISHIRQGLRILLFLFGNS